MFSNHYFLYYSYSSVLLLLRLQCYQYWVKLLSCRILSLCSLLYPFAPCLHWVKSIYHPFNLLCSLSSPPFSWGHSELILLLLLYFCNIHAIYFYNFMFIKISYHFIFFKMICNSLLNILSWLFILLARSFQHLLYLYHGVRWLLSWYKLCFLWFLEWLMTLIIHQEFCLWCSDTRC
jgi:hypothetical protein